MTIEMGSIIARSYTGTFLHLVKTFPEVGLPERLGEEVVKKLARYAEMILAWNDKVDLVAPCSGEELVENHLVDSFAARLVLGAGVDVRGAVLDVGSGAGFPGVVFAVLEPERKVFVCEPREKRVVFLKEVKRELGLRNVEVVGERIEKVRVETVSGVGLLVSRALGEEGLFLKSAARLLKGGGCAVEMVGPSWEIGSESQIEGISFKSVVEYSLPNGAKRKLAAWKCFT